MAVVGDRVPVRMMLAQRIRVVWDKAVTWYRGRSRTYIDLLVIALMIAPLYAYLLYVDAFDTFFRWSRVHEDWEIDELFTLVFCLGLVAIAFSWRRYMDLRREMAQRKEAELESHRLARHDVLTGLPNRRRFRDRPRRDRPLLPASG